MLNVKDYSMSKILRLKMLSMDCVLMYIAVSVFSQCGIFAELSIQNKTDLIRSACENYFGIRSIAILQYKHQGIAEENMRIVKYLSKAGITVAVLPHSEVIQKMELLNNKVVFVGEIGGLSQELLQFSNHWLIFLNAENSKLDSLFIKYNTKFLSVSEKLGSYQLEEVYNVKESEPQRRIAVGSWSTNGLSLVTTGFYQRRINFQGTKLRYLITNLDACDDLSFTTGIPVMCLQSTIWKYTAETLNATTEGMLSLSAFPIYLAGRFARDNIDVSVNAFAFIPTTVGVVSFGWPTFLAELFFFQQYEGISIGWDSYLRPLSTSIWFVVLGWIMLSVVLVFWMRRLARSEEPILWTPLVTFLNQGCSEPELNAWQRILLLSFLIGPAVLIPAYSAALTSFLAVDIPNMPFTDYEGLRAQDTYKASFPTRYYGSSMVIFSEDEDKYMVLSKENLPLTEVDGVKQMCEGKVSFLNSEMFAAALLPLNCSFYRLKKPFLSIFQSLTMPRHSPYTVIINIVIRNMAYSGLMSAMKDRIVQKSMIQRKLSERAALSSPFVSMEDVAVILSIIPFATLLSLFVLACETTWVIFKRKRCCRKITEPPPVLQLWQWQN